MLTFEKQCYYYFCLCYLMYRVCNVSAGNHQYFDFSYRRASS